MTSIKTVGELISFLSHFDKNGTVSLKANGEWPYCTACLAVNNESVLKDSSDFSYPCIVEGFCKTLSRYK